MSPINILIVEDEPPISQLIETSLTQAGYRCTCVFDGPSCANILETCRFDLADNSRRNLHLDSPGALPAFGGLR